VLAAECAAPRAGATLRMNATTLYGKNIFMPGSLGSLANWSSDIALALSMVVFTV
jgi:hypothetical protein